MNFVLFFLVAFSILALGYGYIGWRLIIPANLGAPWNTIAWAALILFLFIPPLAIFMQRYGFAGWRDILSWVAYLSLGFVSLLFTGLETIVEQANALAPDIVAFTGDLVDGSVPHLRHEVAPMAELAARYGRYFITGNHEYYSGAEPWVEEADRLGFDVLLNEHRVLQHGTGRILLAGVTDYSAGQFVKRHASNPEVAISGAPSCEVKILLAHQPRSLYAALPLGFDLQISGHTHGGQFFPWNLLAALGQPYIAGLHKHENMWIYVSRGTGYWGPPLRLGARSEMTVIKLIKATQL
jgi:predicted MPP superfamily phosphohydrolase